MTSYNRRWLIQLRAREMAVSIRTHDLLEYTIERFTRCVYCCASSPLSPFRMRLRSLFSHMIKARKRRIIECKTGSKWGLLPLAGVVTRLRRCIVLGLVFPSFAHSDVLGQPVTHACAHTRTPTTTSSRWCTAHTCWQRLGARGFLACIADIAGADLASGGWQYIGGLFILGYMPASNSLLFAIPRLEPLEWYSMRLISVWALLMGKRYRNLLCRDYLAD